MPVEVVGRPSRGEGRIPGMCCVKGSADGFCGFASMETRAEGLVSPMLRLRKDIWRLGRILGEEERFARLDLNMLFCN